MNRQERNELIDRYEQGHAAVLAEIENLAEAELDAREAPGEWSIREILHHLGDSEMAAAFNLRLILAEDSPVLQGYSHEVWAQNLHRNMPTDPSMTAFAGARIATLPLLRNMSDEDWQRVGTFTDGEQITAETWLTWYGPHAHGHADQLRRTRAVR